MALRGGTCFMASPTAATSATSASISAAIFQQDRFMARQRIFTLSPQFLFYDLSGNTLAFLRKKVFTWRDEIRIFTDQTQSLELLYIKARKIIDWGTAFDITDSINHQKVGVLKRRGWKSLVRSEWTIMDANDFEIGKIQEDSTFLAMVRRYLTNIIPQSYTFEVHGYQAGTARR